MPNDYYISRRWWLMRSVCVLDFVASDYFGWDLVRTTTLAEGGERGDFRFKRSLTRR